MEEVLMYIMYFGAGFLFGDLACFHSGKKGKPDGKMGRDTGSVPREESCGRTGNPGEKQNGACTGTDDPAQPA